MVGHFEDGLMRAAQVATLKTLIDDGGVKVPIFTEPQGPYYKRELATYDHVTSDPLLPDPYEARLIKVAASKVPGSGEGLFAKVDIEPNTIVAFYNGKRIKPRSPVSISLYHTVCI